MGHFGRTPVRVAWLTVVWPGLLLNYFGQGALVLAHPRQPRTLSSSLRLRTLPGLLLLATLAA